MTTRRRVREEVLHTRELESRYPSKERLAAYKSREAAGVRRALHSILADWNETQIQASLSAHLRFVKCAEISFA